MVLAEDPGHTEDGWSKADSLGQSCVLLTNVEKDTMEVCIFFF